MSRNRRHSIQDALFILLAVIMLLVVFCAAWACLDRLSWVRAVMHTVPPGWLRAWLLGW